MIAHALEQLDEVRSAREQAGALLVGLDFDGTLAPIVARPQDAAMSGAMRRVLEALALRADTHVALVSGRALQDLAERAAVAGIWLVGNHGFEIRGPGYERTLPEAASALPALQSIATRLRAELDGMRGAIVEDKTFTLSVHYRMVEDPAAAAAVAAAAVAAAHGVAGVRVTHGKKVVEVRPDVDWNKGRAFTFLRETLAPRIGTAPALFIGDDVTDEDAFRALHAHEWPVYVGDPPDEGTAARARLRSTDEVEEFLRALADG